MSGNFCMQFDHCPSIPLLPPFYRSVRVTTELVQFKKLIGLPKLRLFDNPHRLAPPNVCVWGGLDIEKRLKNKTMM